MGTGDRPFKGRHRGTVFALTALLLGALSALGPVGVAYSGSTLQGAAFSDPSFVQEMPGDWVQRPVEHDPAIGKADLAITLNQQFYLFLEPLIREYAASRGLRFVITKGTCGLSAGMLSKKQVDIGSFCCPPANTDRLPGLVFHTLGIHPVSILVHEDNPLEGLSLVQTRDIFRGKIRRWSEVGGKNLPVQVIGRLHCKKRPGHWRLLLDNENLFAPGMRNVGAIEDMFSLVSTTPAAIGYEVLWLSAMPENRVKTLKVDGIDPKDMKHLVSGAYPLYRALYVTTWKGEGPAEALAEELTAYLIDAIPDLAGEVGIVPAAALKEAGWKFREDELVGGPD